MYAPAALAVVSPPNPNLALDAFVDEEPGGPAFDDAAWLEAAELQECVPQQGAEEALVARAAADRVDDHRST